MGKPSAAAIAAAIHALTVLMAGSVWERSTAVLEARAGAAVRARERGGEAVGGRKMKKKYFKEML